MIMVVESGLELRFLSYIEDVFLLTTGVYLIFVMNLIFNKLL